MDDSTRLNADERKILTNAAKEVQPFQRVQIREAESKALGSLKAKGLVVTEFSPQAAAQMRDKLKPVTEKYSKEAGEALVKEMQAEIDKVRSRK